MSGDIPAPGDQAAPDPAGTDPGGTDPAGHEGSTPVKIKLIDEQNFAHEGRMDFVDNAIDRATGTIRGRAQFGNPDGLFTPGMFANVRVPASQPYEALLAQVVRVRWQRALIHDG